MHANFEVLRGSGVHSYSWVISANAAINCAFNVFNALPLCVMSRVDCFCFIAFVNAFADCMERI